MGQDLYASKGKSAEAVTPVQNAPSSPVPTPILEISPERGQFLRILNQIARGEMQGLPLYLDLRDSNGDPLPVNTTLYLVIEPNGHTGQLVVSEVVESIDQYVTLSITEQRNVDNIDACKLTLQFPESHPSKAGEPTPYVDVRDIDTAYLMCDSAAQIDWSESQAFIDSAAVEQRSR
ncbi:hypothetical protein [Haloarcula marina]|uniref:hypothetical protein n=1 Tax=Haloarcula marina TaxID=2961574 RepID=UPI0020B754C1|nr:hypothetical protein [Halomicroarcula marina]